MKINFLSTNQQIVNICERFKQIKVTKCRRMKTTIIRYRDIKSDAYALSIVTHPPSGSGNRKISKPQYAPFRSLIVPLFLVPVQSDDKFQSPKRLATKTKFKTRQWHYWLILKSVICLVVDGKSTVAVTGATTATIGHTNNNHCGDSEREVWTEKWAIITWGEPPGQSGTGHQSSFSRHKKNTDHGGYFEVRRLVLGLVTYSSDSSDN